MAGNTQFKTVWVEHGMGSINGGKELTELNALLKDGWEMMRWNPIVISSNPRMAYDVFLLIKEG